MIILNQYTKVQKNRKEYKYSIIMSTKKNGITDDFYWCYGTLQTLYELFFFFFSPGMSKRRCRPERLTNRKNIWWRKEICVSRKDFLMGCFQSATSIEEDVVEKVGPCPCLTSYALIGPTLSFQPWLSKEFWDIQIQSNLFYLNLK